jgi:hypothetical protein
MQICFNTFLCSASQISGSEEIYVHFMVGFCSTSATHPVDTYKQVMVKSFGGVSKKKA